MGATSTRTQPIQPTSAILHNPAQGYIGAAPLWAFRFLAARQGSRPSVREPTNLGRYASGGLFAAGKGGDGARSIPTEGSLGRAACWLGGSLGLDIERRPEEKGEFRSLR